MSQIKVAVSGCLGKMGMTVCDAVDAESSMKLVGLIDKTPLDSERKNIRVTSFIRQDHFSEKADVLVDFTHPSSVYENACTALCEKMNCIIGTTGLKNSEVENIKKLTIEKGLFTLIAPNFAIGAVLMMKFSAVASKYMKRAEIIEMHHDKKADAPSGTALLTAKLMAENYKCLSELDEVETLPGSRGGDFSGIKIHSIRLPGFVAHQQVIFGDAGQTLSICHDSVSRESFMPGVIYAIERSACLKGFFYGLESIMDMGF